MTEKVDTNTINNKDYLNEDRKYTPKTAIQRKVRITGLLMLFTFLSIFTMTFMIIVSEIMI